MILVNLSRLVTARPYITLVVLIVITVALAAGATRRAPPTEGASVAFLPPGHAIADATQDIDEFFGDVGNVSVITILFRGEALTPAGLSQMNALINEIVSDPSVGEFLAPTDPVIAPVHLVSAVLQVDSFDSITQAEIDSVRDIPEIQAALAAMTGTDADGTPVAIANIRLNDTGDERVKDAERRISQLATGEEGSLRVSSISPVVVEDEYREATESGMAPLIGLAYGPDRSAAAAFHAHTLRHAADFGGVVFSLVSRVGSVCHPQGHAELRRAGPVYGRPEPFPAACPRLLPGVSSRGRSA